MQTNETLGSLESSETCVRTIRLTLLTKVLEGEFPKEAAHAVFDFAFMIYIQAICMLSWKDLKQHTTGHFLLPQYCDMSGSDFVIPALLILIKNKLFHIYINTGSRIFLVLQY